jgi:hypothetical protein
MSRAKTRFPPGRQWGVQGGTWLHEGRLLLALPVHTAPHSGAMGAHRLPGTDVLLAAPGACGRTFTFTFCVLVPSWKLAQVLRSLPGVAAAVGCMMHVGKCGPRDVHSARSQ